ncbi:hypothetical protein [Stenotrophomonas sp.]|uniref:hypothetical protein n=1 Tax=Stenotrophomonas sp. TaxID=69392 RepID=UPI0028B0172F|nr:hypothetical protein [Stenotrophomonas sp.]
MILEIQTAYQALSAGMSALRAVQSADKAINEAEWKLKLADAMTALADAKFSLANVSERTEELRNEIGRLNEALKTKASVVRYLDGYYRKAPDGSAMGEAFCSRCYEVDARLIHILRPVRADIVPSCPQCKTQYDRRNVAPQQSALAAALAAAEVIPPQRTE